MLFLGARLAVRNMSALFPSRHFSFVFVASHGRFVPGAERGGQRLVTKGNPSFGTGRRTEEPAAVPRP